MVSEVEARLRESERRFRALTTATSDVVYRMSPDWREMRQLDGRGFLADTGSPSVAWIDEYLFPEDQAAILAAIDDAIQAKGVFQLEHRVRRADGSIGWTASRAVPVFDEDGRIIEWFGAASDVTERRRADEQLRLVVDELNHRVKNNLAVVQSIAMQTFRTAGGMAEAQESFIARIAALAHAIDLLTGDASEGRSLREILDRAVRAHAPEAARCEMAGPELELPPRVAHALSLMLHELVTNAIKHGAWSAERGRVAIDWSSRTAARGGRRFHLEWTERDGPAVTPPARKGFGARLIERTLASEMGGKVQLHFDPAGLACVMDVPLACVG